MDQASFHCPQCQQQRLFTRNGVNHVVHLLVTLFLCGLWLPVWIIIAASQSSNPYFCSSCGYSGTSGFLINPQRNAQNLLLAQQRAAAYQERRKGYDNLDLQGKLRWQFKENMGAFIGGGLFVLLLGFGLVFSAISALLNPSYKRTESPAAQVVRTPDGESQKAIQQRRDFATLAQKEYRKKVAGAVTSTSGTESETLWITAPSFSDQTLDNFKRTGRETIVKMRSLGFKTLIFGNGKKDWSIQLEDALASIPPPPAPRTLKAKPTPTPDPYLENEQDAVLEDYQSPPNPAPSKARTVNTPAVESYSPPSYTPPSSSRYILGPRGGCYYINRNGNKTYVDRSLCN